MMEFIDPTAPKTNEEIHRIRMENQIDSKLARLFASTIPKETERPASTIVDWSFIDTDDDQPGEPADWVKKQIKQLEKWGDNDDLHKEMLEEMKQRHQWTRNIPPPSIPKRYDPNGPPFNPSDILDHTEDDLVDDT